MVSLTSDHPINPLVFYRKELVMGERLAPHGGCNWKGCRECFPRMSEDDRWSLYVWDRGRMKWMPQENYTSLPLEQALTALLRWKSEGQIVRMDSVSGLL